MFVVAFTLLLLNRNKFLAILLLLANIAVKGEGNQTCFPVSSHVPCTVPCSLCTLIPGSLAHATVVKYGGVNKSNGLDLLSASQQLNRKPQGNEVQVAIMGNMEMSVFYKVDKDWESIVVWNLQERFVLSTDIHSATTRRKRCMLTVEFGPHYKYAKHPSPMFQSPTLAAAGQFHKMFESSEFSRSLGGKSGFPREKKTHGLVNETGETQADATVVNCRQRMPTTCTPSASRFVSPTREKNSQKLNSLSGCKLLPVWKTIPNPGARERERE